MLNGPSIDQVTERETRLGAIRGRLVLTLMVEFVALMALAAIEGFWSATGPGHDQAVAALLAVAVALPLIVARLARTVIAAIEAVEAERDRLVELYGRARSDALLDGLTGLGNHRAFQEELARQLEHSRRHGSRLSLLLVDVDDLKKVNDEQGHAGGDELLAAVGRVSAAAVRKTDRAFRVG